MEAKVPASLPPWPAWLALTINLIPIAGVLLWGWDAFALIFLYWLENVVIGVRTVLAMLITATNAPVTQWGGALFFAGFFTLHYGLFCYGHGTFVIGMFGGSDDFHVNLYDAARKLFMQEPNLAWGFASIVIWQAVQVSLFVLRGEHLTSNPLDLMGAPYPRIIVLHLAILGGGFLLVAMNEPIAGLIILAMFKAAFDIAEAIGKMPRFAFSRMRG